MRIFIVALTVVLMITAASQAGTPYSVPISSSILIDYIDYSDSFTTGLNSRDNWHGLDWYAWAGFPEALEVEDICGSLEASWSRGWNHPGGGSNVWFHDVNTPPLKTGEGNADANSGTVEFGTDDVRHKYGIARERFMIQFDAIQPLYYDDRLDIGFSAVDYTGGGQADWVGNADQTTFIFIRSDGAVDLYTVALGDQSTDWDTGLDTAYDANEWHNFAILYDVENDTMELFVDEVSVGVQDLTNVDVEGYDFSGVPTEYIGVGGYGGIAIDNYQIGSYQGILEFDLSDGSNIVEEGGATDTFTVALSSAPSAGVAITLSDPNNEVTFVPGVLNFTTGDWDTPQSVEITAVDDGDTERNEYAYIRFASVSTDADFNDTTADVLPVLVIDDDVPEVVINESDDSTDVSEEGATQDQYTMVLGFLPTADVNVYMDFDANQISVVPTALTFTTVNWDTPQGVTVTAIDDPNLEADPHTTQIVHTVASLDSLYDELPVDNVSVSITENECGAWGYHDMDINEDCYVDFLDFAMMAEKWLDCTMPFGAGCEDLIP